MNRRGFFRLLGLGAAAAVVAPKVIGEVVKPVAHGLSGEPMNFEPFRPNPSTCGFVYTIPPEAVTFLCPTDTNYVIYYTADNPSSGPCCSYIWQSQPTSG